MDEKEIYREIILDHRNNPRGKALNEAYDFSFAGNMPECMDELILCGNWKDDTLSRLHFRGVGCPVSTASVSLLCSWASDKGRNELVTLLNGFLEMLRNPTILPDAEIYGDAIALSSIREFSSRTKCAIFPWETFLAFLEESYNINN